MHELIEQYNKGIKTPTQLQIEYLTSFRSRVKGQAPNQSVFENYFQDGLRYLQTMNPIQCKVLSVENQINSFIKGVPFVGYIDLITEAEDKTILLIDNKSRALKPRSNRKKPTKSDIELDEYLKQLYLYSSFVFEKYKRFPDKLCFNCFRKGIFIEEPFVLSVYDDTIDWFLKNIGEIILETEFRPAIEYFKCRYLCEMQDYCDYYELSKR